MPQITSKRLLAEPDYLPMPLDVLRTISDEMEDGILVARWNGVGHPLLFVNKAFETITGYSAAEALGKDCRYLQGNDCLQPEIALVRSALKSGKPVDVTLRNYRKDGTLFWNQLSLRLARTDDAHPYVVGIMRDVSKVLNSELELVNSHQKDRLTGSYSRDGFAQKLSNTPITNNLLAIVKMDIARFREINAGFGHDVANSLLCGFCERLNRIGAVLVGRLSGDEFVLALDAVDELELQSYLTKLVDALGRPFVLAGTEISVDCKIGYVVAKEWDVTLLHHAGLALLRAKTKEMMVPRRYESPDDEAAKSRIQLRSELQQAIRHNEFAYHFQPKVDMRSGKILGAEALVRWNHPLLGLQYPDRFISVAEETGLIRDIDEQGLRQVAEIAVEINKGRLQPLTFAFNFSAKDFRARKITEVVKKIICETGIDPTWLTLEITESLLVKSDERMVSVLRTLRQLGVGLSLDDFGTGYSCLRYLDQFPISEVKIDRSFVSNMMNSPAQKFIIKAVIDLGNKLGLDVVTEGVEILQQRDVLLELGCSLAQGYLFSKPLDIDAFAKLTRHPLLSEPLQCS